MSQAFRRLWRFAPLALLLVIGPETSIGQAPVQIPISEWSAPTSLVDPRMEPLRRAAVTWNSKLGPERVVIDQVCLVPDFPTFLDAIATWDRGHWFPILFDDIETSFRFIRAFKPARIVRFPKSSAAIPRDRRWDRALSAIGASWSTGGSSPQRLAADVPPRSLGATPPGVVVSAPEAPMLAGAVALAAGRFQPLLRLDQARKFGDVLTSDQFSDFDRDLTALIRRKIPQSQSIGDDCDFVTLAGDWPYRWRDGQGDLTAVDDSVARAVSSPRRWAFAGRLMGDPAESVYRAMASLFLQPDSALLFNGYDESSSPWSDYAMRTATAWLGRVLPTSQVSGERAGGLDGWHETFDPMNKHGLVLINSHGSPDMFNIRSGPAGVADIPRGVPSVILMIHSFSAASPADPSTIAGRWLANGAYIYFGSMNEPFLQSFRTPRLVADLLVERLPVVAAVRSNPPEPFAKPWRLMFLGDPLYRVVGKDSNKPRLASWEPTTRWPPFVEPPRPVEGSDFGILSWSWKTALGRMKGTIADEPQTDLAETLLEVQRSRLPQADRLTFDSLLIEVLLQARKRGALRSRIAAIPPLERSEPNRRCYETLIAIELSYTIAGGDPAKAGAVWSEMIQLEAPRELKAQATARVARLVVTPVQRREWARLLRETLRDHPKLGDADVVESELKRVEAIK